jgi:hypothetical protein
MSGTRSWMRLAAKRTRTNTIRDRENDHETDIRLCKLTVDIRAVGVFRVDIEICILFEKEFFGRRTQAMSELAMSPCASRMGADKAIDGSSISPQMTPTQGTSGWTIKRRPASRNPLYSNEDDSECPAKEGHMTATETKRRSTHHVQSIDVHARSCDHPT